MTELLHSRHRLLWPLAVAQCQLGEIAHDSQHILRVYRWAVRLAPEAQVDPDLAGAAALVHDLVFVPKNSDQRATGGERSAAAAPAVLRQAQYRDDEIAAIVEAVRTCSWSRRLSAAAPLGDLLQDADRLDALGAIGVARLYACAQFMSTPAKPSLLHHGDDPAAERERPLDDRHHAADHIRIKLLKLADSMHFPSSQAEARRRHVYLVAHLDELRREAE